MEVKDFEIEGLKLLTNKRFGDERGFFTERFRIEWSQNFGWPNFVQENYSRSTFGVLRGLHFQFSPPQGKLVTCTRGSLYDVAVDIRKNSATYGKYVGVQLSGDQPQWFWIPAGFAHGFLVTSADGADLLYKTTACYEPDGEGAIAWNDAEVGINWPLDILKSSGKSPLLSTKDTLAQSFGEYSKSPKF